MHQNSQPETEDPAVLLLGSSGFIGSHLHRRLRLSGEVVIGFSRNHQSLPEVCADTSDPLWLVKILKQRNVSVLVNAMGRVSNSPTRALDARGWQEIRKGFQEASEYLPRLRRILHIGSAAEYGGSKIPFKESDVPNPTNSYGQSKFEETKFMTSLIASGSRVTVIRPSNVIGSNLRGSMLVPTALRAITTGKKMVVSNPYAVRNYIYVEDLVDGLTHAIRIVGNLPPILNFGSPYNLSTMSTLNALSESIGVTLEQFVSGKLLAKAGKECLDSTDTLTLDSRLASQELGWKAKTDVRSAFLKIGNDLGIIR